MPPIVESQQTTGVVEIGMVTHRRKDIQYLAVVCRGVADSIGGKNWQFQRLGDSDCRLIAPLLLTFTVTLDFNVNAVSSENSYQPFDRLTACLLTAAHKRGGQRAFVATREADQAGRVFLQVVEGSRTFALDPLPHLEAGDELTKILVADPRLAQQGQPRGFGGM